MIRPGSATLGELLINSRRISPGQLEEALAEQASTRQRLGEILCRLGFCTPDDLMDGLASQFDLPRFDPAAHAVEPSALEQIPAEFARRHLVLPVRIDQETLHVAVTDPLDVEVLDPVRRFAERAGRRLGLLLATTEALQGVVERHYGRAEGDRDVHRLITSIVDEMSETSSDEEEFDPLETERRARDAGIVRLVDQIIGQAVRERATDIHIEPLERGLVIRYRIDGLLQDSLHPPRAVYLGLVSRLKILSNLDIAERRAPQDGRFTHRTDDRVVDIRVSALPTIHGEKLVLRLLDKSGFSYSLRTLGFSETDYAHFQRAIHRPHGMVLLSGPTGSGKTTTLYAALLELRNEAINVLTVEDPVEYQISRINQVQVNERKRLTFASALRSFLRQDPDVIMVGEIRDRDTAEIAVRAALTGHLVFSTIHANDAPSTATRLLSMGVEPFAAASALTLVAAQRLVRRNCPHCLVDYEPGEEMLIALGDSEELRRAGRLARGAGCAACGNRGYSGRIAIVEVMPVTPRLRELAAASRPADEIRQAALAEGMKTLRRSGLEKALAGLTTLEEVVRVCASDE